MTQGLRSYQRIAAALSRRKATNLERLIRKSRSREAEIGRFNKGQAFAPDPKNRPTCD
jgi:hypothetical protein